MFCRWHREWVEDPFETIDAENVGISVTVYLSCIALYKYLYNMIVSTSVIIQLHITNILISFVLPAVFLVIFKLLPTLVCCQPTELIWVFLFHKLSSFTPPPLSQVERDLNSAYKTMFKLGRSLKDVGPCMVSGAVIKVHFGSKKTGKISIIFEPTSTSSFSPPPPRP